MLILGDYLGIERELATPERLAQVRTTFYFVLYFPITIIVVNETLNTKFFFFQVSSISLKELERLPERLFLSLIEDFIDVQQTTAFNSLEYCSTNN